jgi:WhiB family redox-sensing transcriptional regulator
VPTLSLAGEQPAPPPLRRSAPCAIVTDVGPVTAPPYRVRVNEALVQWLMSAPDGPDERLTLEDFLQRPAWHQEAACAGQTDLFFVKGTPPTRTRQICGGCPVREECLAYALADPELVGLWGGTTERERRELRRQRVA